MRMLDITKAEKEFGLRVKVSMEEGLERTRDWYRAHKGLFSAGYKPMMIIYQGWPGNFRDMEGIGDALSSSR